MPEPFDRRNFRFNGRWPGQAIYPRTRVFPVKFEAGQYHPVGINFQGYRRFASDQGMAAEPLAIYFISLPARETPSGEARGTSSQSSCDPIIAFGA